MSTQFVRPTGSHSADVFADTEIIHWYTWKNGGKKMRKVIISLIVVFLFALGSSPGADLTADWDPAPDTNNYTHSATTEHAVGHIVGWGDNSHSECSAFDGRDFVAIAAGGSHNIALKNNGTLAAWGDNTCCQCSNTPVGNDFVAISAGDS
jgi:hypothetical protein